MFFGKEYIMNFERNHNVKKSLNIGHTRSAVPVGIIWLIKKMKENNPDRTSGRTEEVNEKYIPQILERLSEGHRDIRKYNKIFKKYVGFIVISENGKMIDLRENPGTILSYKEKFYKIPE